MKNEEEKRPSHSNARSYFTVDDSQFDSFGTSFNWKGGLIYEE